MTTPVTTVIVPTSTTTTTTPETIAPRLLDIRGAAAYLGGLSRWTVRQLVADGHLKVVRLPSVRRPGEASRRVLFDRADLDAFVETVKKNSL